MHRLVQTNVRLHKATRMYSGKKFHISDVPCDVHNGSHYKIIVERDDGSKSELMCPIPLLVTRMWLSHHRRESIENSKIEDFIKHIRRDV